MSLQPTQWTELPTDQDVNILAGYFYSAVVAVDIGDSTQSVKDRIASYGLQLTDFQDPAPPPAGMAPADSGQRYVAAIAYATKNAGGVPIKVPWGLRWVDSSHAVKVWVSPSADRPDLPPAPPPAPAGFPWGPVLTIGGVAGAGGLAYWLWRRKVKGRRLSA